MRRFIPIAAAVLALLGILFSAEHFTDIDHHNAGFVEYPLITGSHVALGALYLGFALLQFSTRVRTRWPSVHRALGRVAVVAGLTSGVTALVMTALYPYSGPIAMVVVGPFACLFIGSLARGLWLARARRYPAHREWMIRAMAIATSIATMRLFFVPTLLMLGESEEIARWLSLCCFALAFFLHSGVAEVWIRETRSGAEPGVAGESPAATTTGG